MTQTTRITIPNDTDAQTWEVRTDTDSDLLLHLCPTWITDSKGERMGDYVVGLSIRTDTGAETDGLQFTSLTPMQVEVLIEQLIIVQDKAKQLNRVING